MFVALRQKDAEELMDLQSWSCSSGHWLDPYATLTAMSFLLQSKI